MSWQVGLYVAAVLIPLAAFAVEAIFIRQLKSTNALIATGAIGLSCVLSLIGFVAYSFETSGFHHHAELHAAAAEAESAPAAAEHHEPLVWSGSFDWVLLGGRPRAPRTTRPLRPPGPTSCCRSESRSTASP